MENKIIIAVDGFASCGKSTLAKSLAAKLGYTYIDTGAMYRSATLYFLNNNIDYNDPVQVEAALPKIKVEFRNDKKGKRSTFLNGLNVEEEIRKMRVSSEVSEVSTISSVRRAMVAQQQEMGIEKGLVLDGRDIGTVVFKDAELKLFLTANIKVRTNRRLKEMEKKGIDIDYEGVKENLLHRDHIDSTRDDSPLRKAKDAIEIDNSELNMEEQLNIAHELALERILVAQ